MTERNEDIWMPEVIDSTSETDDGWPGFVEIESTLGNIADVTNPDIYYCVRILREQMPSSFSPYGIWIDRLRNRR